MRNTPILIEADHTAVVYLGPTQLTLSVKPGVPRKTALYKAGLGRTGGRCTCFVASRDAGLDTDDVLWQCVVHQA